MSVLRELSLDMYVDEDRVIVPKKVLGTEMTVLINRSKIVAVLDSEGNPLDNLLCDYTWKKLREYIQSGMR